MFLYPHPVYPRKSREVAFKRLYNLVMVLNFAAWIIVFMDFVSRVDNTFDKYWSSDVFAYYPPLAKVLDGCNHTMVVTFFNMDAETEMTAASSPYHFLQVTAAIRAIFIIHACSIGFDFLAKIMFALNVRHVRVRGMHIPANHIFLLLMLCLSCCLLGLVVETEGQRHLLDDYVNYCTGQFKINNNEAFVQAEQDSKTVFGTAIPALFWMTVVNLGVYVFSFIFLMVHSFTEPTARILKLDFPWEKGLLCKPNKPVLVSYCRERADWEKQVMNIDVDQELRKKSLAAALEYNPTAVPDVPVDIVTNPNVPPPQQVYRPMTEHQLHVYPVAGGGGPPPQQAQPTYYNGQPASMQQPEELMPGDTDGGELGGQGSGVDGGQLDGLDNGAGGDVEPRPKKKVKKRKSKSGASGEGGTTGEEDEAGGERHRKRHRKSKPERSDVGQGDGDVQPEEAFVEA